MNVSAAEMRGRWCNDGNVGVWAPEVSPAVHRTTMAIDKESSGFPEVDIRKRTTKVNLAVVIGVGVFLGAMFAVALWFWATRP